MAQVLGRVVQGGLRVCRWGNSVGEGSIDGEWELGWEYGVWRY
jgi:hypothetical protein